MPRTMPRRTQANNKTQPTATDVLGYIDALDHAGRAEDAHLLLRLMSDLSGEQAKMWGPSIIGFGQYHYRYDSGREGDSFLVGFAPRKANMVVYIMPGFERYTAQLAKLGKYRTGSSCLYLGRLSSIDLQVLGEIITDSVEYMRHKWS